MTEDTKIADLTVAQFRALMQECMDADRTASEREERARLHKRDAMPPEPVTSYFSLGYPKNPLGGLWERGANVDERARQQERNTEMRKRLDNG